MELYRELKQIEFDVDGRFSVIVCPENPLPGNPWIWRAEFIGAFDSVDRALLKKGWHLAYHRVSDMYGCPESIQMMKSFYDVCVKKYGLSKGTVLFGFSRGALYSVNFALKYPDEVKCLYLDAPVTNLLSWPAKNYPHEWQECMQWYHLSEETAPDFKDSPNNHAETVAKAGIPLILVAGDSDHVVPFEENGQIFAEKFAMYSEKILTIVKPGCDHHPHSLTEPEPVVEFIERVTQI